MDKQGSAKAVIFFLMAVCLAFLAPTCAKEDVAPEPVVTGPPVSVSEVLEDQCKNYVGEARVERISEHVWAAMGFDLAHTVLIHTDEGNVIVDTAMSPSRAREIRTALEAEAPKGKVLAIILTHSHIDHVGGTSVWAEPGTQIWATDTHTEHFLKQYGMFRPAETVRAMRQFGHHLDMATLPCSALGARMDINAALETGVILPDHTFHDTRTLAFGGLEIVMTAAPGETHDQLFVWVPADKTLLPGDNFYHAFPNLYTVRGTSPRPVREWIRGLDKMRALAPEHMIPQHTAAVHGRENIARALTDYRDGIQWVHDEVVRRANRLEDMDTMRESIKLPPHLANTPYLRELYGQVDWSVQAIYDNNLGWFDGEASDLYNHPAALTAAREIGLMGGAEKVLAEAEAAMAADPKWAIHLLVKLKKSGLAAERQAEIDRDLASCYRDVAKDIANTNGRAYLLEAALELEHGQFKPQTPRANPGIVESVPLDLIFSIMTIRLDTQKAMDVHRSARFVFPDADKEYTITIRHGVAEIVEGEPLPYTPEPIATLTTDSNTYRRIAMGLTDAAREVLAGKVKIDGKLSDLVNFLDMFESGI